MRGLIKHWSYRALTPWLLQRHNRQHAVIGLSYHRFTPAHGRDLRPHMALSPETFALHLGWLNELGTCISIDEYLADESAPGTAFMLSFDDGYADNAERLPGLLEAHEAPCCVYAVSDYVRGRIKRLPHDEQAGYEAAACTPEQLLELASHPLITIGSHTVSHRLLSVLSGAEVLTELVDSKDALEQILQQPVHHFAAPSGQPGDLPPDLPERAAEAGYRSFASNFGGFNPRPAAGAARHIRRVPMTVKAEEWTVKGWALGGHGLREMRTNETLSDWDQAAEVPDDPS